MTRTFLAIALVMATPLAALFLHAPVFAQPGDEAIEADIAFVLDVLREDYAGFETKVTAGNTEAFERAVALMRERIANRPDARIHAISALLESFEDGHLTIRSKIVSPDDPWPAAEPEASRIRSSPELPYEFAFRRLSPQTLYLRVPSFDSDHAETFHKLLEQHHDDIISTPNLIVDVRHNSGGQDFVYAPLMAYLYTRPIYSIGAEFRASTRNLAMLEAIAADPETPQATLDFLASFMGRARAAAPGEWVSLDERGFSIETYPQIYQYPRRVGILAEGASSTGDQFVMDARASRKVTLFGGPTSGVIDYSNVVAATAPSGEFDIAYPLTRSMRLPEEPLDNVGVQPDIAFGDEVADHVEAARLWLEKGCPVLDSSCQPS